MDQLQFLRRLNGSNSELYSYFYRRIGEEKIGLCIGSFRGGVAASDVVVVVDARAAAGNVPPGAGPSDGVARAISSPATYAEGVGEGGCCYR